MKKNKVPARFFSFTGILILFLWGSSCQLLSTGEEGDSMPVARVYDRYLYTTDIDGIVPEELNDNDSLAFLQNYISVWAKDQLMLYKAEYNLTEQQKDFEEQIRNYRNDLLKFAYKQEYIRQNLDTNISEKAIEGYYEDNGDNFELKENILKARYIILNENAPQLDKARQWFRSSKVSDQSDLKEYALKYATEFSLEDTAWISFDRITSKLPIEASNQSEFLANNKFIELTGQERVYLLEIVAYKIKEGKSPLPYVKEVIRNILINKRKLDLLAALEKSLLEDALEKKEFETF